MPTLEAFRTMLGKDADTMSQTEIEAYYSACTGFFNVFFEKWKKEKIPKSGLKT